MFDLPSSREKHGKAIPSDGTMKGKAFGQSFQDLGHLGQGFGVISLSRFGVEFIDINGDDPRVNLNHLFSSLPFFIWKEAAWSNGKECFGGDLLLLGFWIRGFSDFFGFPSP